MTAFAQPAAGWIRPPQEGTAGEIASMVMATVKHAASHAPRSLQAAPGPSQIGTPCTRRLGYHILDWEPKPNSDTDPWTATIGTSVHAWMAETFAQWNGQLGEPGGEQWLIEHRIRLPGGITGSCDLYDRWHGRVIDWKITSPANIAKYRKNGPGPQYRAQIHLYGLGMQLAGEHPRDVAICFLPRGGRIDGLHVWSEPYDHRVAVGALKRYQAVRQFLYTADPERHPERWAWLATADAYCTYCPFHLPGSADLSQGCPGHQPKDPSKEK
jgi:hypothetical protein